MIPLTFPLCNRNTCVYVFGSLGTICQEKCTLWPYYPHHQLCGWNWIIFYGDVFPLDDLLLLWLDSPRLTEFPDGQISELVAKIAKVAKWSCCSLVTVVQLVLQQADSAWTGLWALEDCLCLHCSTAAKRCGVEALWLALESTRVTVLMTSCLLKKRNDLRLDLDLDVKDLWLDLRLLFQYI